MQKARATPTRRPIDLEVGDAGATIAPILRMPH
jgi:hypothetical protein